jgi:hypothetical protein
VTVADFASFIAFDEQGVATTSGTRQKKRKYVEGDGDGDESSSTSTSHYYFITCILLSCFIIFYIYFITIVIKIVNSGWLIKFYEDGVLRGTVDSSLPPLPILLLLFTLLCFVLLYYVLFCFSLFIFIFL